jgi:hypothetical protein
MTQKVHPTPSMRDNQNVGNRINVFTVASIGILAFGLEPIVHEVLGHALVCWLTGGKVILISSTAMQTSSTSRLVPAAGPLANILFGLAAFALLRALATQQNTNSSSRSDAAADTTRLFLYFFAFANLFLATGYILYSGLINFGDFAAVITGLRPAWLYRAALVVIGALSYRYGIAQAARSLAQLLTPAYTPRSSSADAPPPPASTLPSVSTQSPPLTAAVTPSASAEAPPLPAAPLQSPRPQSPPLIAAPISLPAARRITHTACFAGGALFLLASCLNPISPNLILYDGLSGTIGLTLGFFLALTDLRQSVPKPTAKFPAAAAASQNAAPELELPFKLPLTITATIFALAFLFFMGRGIPLP